VARRLATVIPTTTISTIAAMTEITATQFIGGVITRPRDQAQ
jgi:hypothetical protein